MKPAEQLNDTCQDTERSPNSMISCLPDEVLLEIFDYYRQLEGISHQWKKKYAWFNLTHVCRKWRSVMLASSFRLDLGITVGPQKPGNIKTILSSSLPILIDYKYTDGNIKGSALWRLRAVLRHHDRVREISFEGTSASFDELYRASNCPFPVLEGLALHFSFCNESPIPDAFLRGQDLSVLHLRRLRLTHVSFASISGFLSSTTALTDLHLAIDIAGTALLSCLQGMLCLRSLTLFIMCRSPDSSWQPSTPKDVVPLSKLTSFRYVGEIVVLDALVAGLSAPSLWDFMIDCLDVRWPPIVHLPRFVSEIEGRSHSVQVAFLYSGGIFSLLQSEEIGQFESRFYLICPPSTPPSGSIFGMSGVLSTRLTTVEELRVTFDKMRTDAKFWVDNIPWLRFYQQFPGVKVLRTEGANDDCIARTLLQAYEEHGDDDLGFLPALEEIELGKKLWTRKGQRETRLAAFQPFVSARQQAGRPVKVCFRP